MVRWYHVFYIFLGSRIFFAALLYLFKFYWLPGVPNTDGQITVPNTLVDLFTYYDAYNYHDIVIEGYARDKLTAFFPLLPLFVWLIVKITGLEPYTAGIFFSNLCYLAALIMLAKILEIRSSSKKTTVITLTLLSLYPGAYFFSAFYTESLFLLLVLTSFYLWKQEKVFWALFIAGLCPLARLVGFFVPFAFFVERLIQRRLTAREFGYFVMSGLMGALYPMYLWIEKNDPIMFNHVLEQYFRKPSIFFITIIQDIKWFINDLAVNNTLNFITLFHFILFGLLICFFFSIFTRKSSFSIAEIIFAAGLVLMPLSTAVYNLTYVASHGFLRYILPVFPFFIFLGERLARMVEKKSIALIAWALVWIAFSFIFIAVLSFKDFIA